MRRAVAATAKWFALAAGYLFAFAGMLAAVGAIWGMELARRAKRRAWKREK